MERVVRHFLTSFGLRTKWNIIFFLLLEQVEKYIKCDVSVYGEMRMHAGVHWHDLWDHTRGFVHGLVYINLNHIITRVELIYYISAHPGNQRINTPPLWPRLNWKNKLTHAECIEHIYVGIYAFPILLKRYVIPTLFILFPKLCTCAVFAWRVPRHII